MLWYRTVGVGIKFGLALNAQRLDTRKGKNGRRREDFLVCLFYLSSSIRFEYFMFFSFLSGSSKVIHIERNK